MRVLGLIAVLAGVGCGGGPPPAGPAPQSVDTALSEFMAAVKAHDITRMATLWGTPRGPAAQWMDREPMRQRLTVIQKYLMHIGYRVLETTAGPPVKGTDGGATRTMRIELQRQGCNSVMPIDLVRSRAGGWLVYDVHLESAGNPARCARGASGTQP